MSSVNGRIEIYRFWNFEWRTSEIIHWNCGFLSLGVASCCASIQLGFLWRRRSQQSSNMSKYWKVETVVFIVRNNINDLPIPIPSYLSFTSEELRPTSLSVSQLWRYIFETLSVQRISAATEITCGEMKSNSMLLRDRATMPVFLLRGWGKPRQIWATKT
jgi:hypothetical protein